MELRDSAAAANPASANDIGLPYASLEELADWAERTMASREPDFVIGEPDRPYLRRWFIIPRNEYQNIYLHEILRSDDDRAGHDHPWSNTSLLISGEYEEVIYDDYKPWIEVDRWTRGPGELVARHATDTHRLIIPEGGRAVSLFFTGPKEREWGFWCPEGPKWVPWRDFTGGAQGEIVGQGCGE